MFVCYFLFFFSVMVVCLIVDYFVWIEKIVERVFEDVYVKND